MFVEKWLMHQHIVSWFKQREYKERRKLNITLILDKDSKQWHVNYGVDKLVLDKKEQKIRIEMVDTN